MKSDEPQRDKRWCAACASSGQVWVRGREKTIGHKVLHSTPWESASGAIKYAIECRCVKGAPHDYDPSLPGNSRCACKGRGWEQVNTEADVPEGREVLGRTLSGRLMVKCPCTPTDAQRGVQREAIPTHQDELDLGPDIAGMWAVD